MTASVACLAAVSVILGRVQDQPASDWTFFVRMLLSSDSSILETLVQHSNCNTLTCQISLNATIAALITAAESLALLAVSACIGQWKWIYYRSKTRKLKDFDTIEDASRGPYGSVVLLAKVRLSGVASLGALVTILALGIDTFAQQVISTDVVTTWVADGSATFGLASSYSSGAKMNAAESLWAPIRQYSFSVRPC